MEIGPKTVPWIDYLRPDLLTGGQRVLVERDPQAANLLKGAERGAIVITGSAESMGEIADRSVGVVLAKDFFGAHGKFPSTVAGRFLGMRENIGDWKRIASELHRVCRDGGRVVIAETSTPADRSNVLEVFEGAGFNLIEDRFGIDAWDVFEGIPKERLSQADDAFSLVFQK